MTDGGGERLALVARSRLMLGGMLDVDDSDFPASPLDLCYAFERPRVHVVRLCRLSIRPVCMFAVQLRAAATISCIS